MNIFYSGLEEIQISKTQVAGQLILDNQQCFDIHFYYITTYILLIQNNYENQ